jgi:anti-sigma regulatory factor (Ser/Thr protein kinase)
MTVAQHETAPSFRHEALFYAGDDDFVRRLVPFVRDGLARDDAVLVVLVPRRLSLLRTALGDDARRVTFADMTAVGRNPARIIEAWHEFVVANATRPGIRGIGEPIHTERSAAEIAECHTHEALLNVAFDGRGPFRLVCPYNTATLPESVVRTALRTHPFVLGRDGAHERSTDYERVQGWPALVPVDFDAPSAPFEEHDFDVHSLYTMRRRVVAHATAAGLNVRRTHDVVVAINEIATNSVHYGGGRGHYRIWHERAAVVCEISDAGQIGEPLVGRIRPADPQIGGYGIWLANHLCDLVQIRSGPRGTTVRVHARR